MVHVAKIIEVVGSSDKGWEDAAQVAVDEAKKTIHGITGCEITDMTAKVDSNTGRITQFRSAVKIAFGIEHGSQKKDIGKNLLKVKRVKYFSKPTGQIQVNTSNLFFSNRGIKTRDINARMWNMIMFAT